MTTEIHRSVREKYLTFADHEARGVSPLYESLSRAVAQTPALVELIGELPSPKQQPNLIYAAFGRFAACRRQRTSSPDDSSINGR